jgi:hypothetical protein
LLTSSTFKHLSAVSQEHDGSCRFIITSKGLVSISKHAYQNKICTSILLPVGFIVVLSNQKKAALGFAQSLLFLGGDQKECRSQGQITSNWKISTAF